MWAVSNYGERWWAWGHVEQFIAWAGRTGRLPHLRSRAPTKAVTVMSEEDRRRHIRELERALEYVVVVLGEPRQAAATTGNRWDCETRT